MNDDALREEMRRIKALAKARGLDFFDVSFDVITKRSMVEFGTYILPARYSHWTFGKDFGKLRKYSELGILQILEMVLNLDPAMAFLLDSNSDVENKMVIAHVYGHCDFFKNNHWFSLTDRDMLSMEQRFEFRIRELRALHGREEVERAMDIAMSLQWHVDFYGQFGKRGVSEKADLLLYLMRNAPVESYQAEILDMVRQESLYFYPNTLTKMMNEGWATFWHCRLLREYLNFGEFEVFAAKNAELMAGGGLNPYKLGYLLFEDIARRWEAEFGEGAGLRKLFEVRALEDDVSFIRNYLTQDICDACGLFLYETDPETGEVTITSTHVEDIKASIISELLSRPRIEVVEGDDDGHGGLYLVHRYDGRELYLDYAGDVLMNIHALWKAPVHFDTVLEGKRVRLTYDGTECLMSSLEEAEGGADPVTQDAQAAAT